MDLESARKAKPDPNLNVFTSSESANNIEHTIVSHFIFTKVWSSTT